LIQGVNGEEIAYGMKHRLIAEEDFLKASRGENVRLNITEATRRLSKGLGKLSMLRRLRNAARLMREIKMLYKNYPDSPEDFVEWEKRTHELISTAKRFLARKQ